MLDDFSTFADPAMTNFGPSASRSPQPRRDVVGLKDATIVSADGHWEISDDIFYENFPDRLKAKAPRVWFDKYWHVGYPGGVQAFGAGDRIDNVIQKHTNAGIWDLELRAAHMEAEGVQKEIVFPQSLFGFARYGDAELHEYMYRIYNEYIAARGRNSSGRFFGVGICSNWWDPAKARQAVKQIADLGLKTFMIPVNPGKTLEGQSINYAGPEMEVFWRAAAEGGLPVNFHIGENPSGVEERAGIPRSALTSFAALRKPFAELVFGGVFDRNPDLKIVFSEAGIAWIPPLLQDSEMIYDTFGRGDCIDDIQHRPGYYWHNNCYATFQNDLVGLRQINDIGADRVMWAVDYPHAESSFGFTQNSIQSVLNATSLDNAKKILGGNAAHVYNLT